MIHPWNKVRCLILDVDGICTDGSLLYGPNGETIKRFYALDGHGIKLLLKNNIQVAIISGRDSAITSQRFSELGVQHIYQGKSDKTPAFKDLLQKLQLNEKHVAYMGDDIPDIPLLKAALIGISVPKAHPEAKKHSDFICTQDGGYGAVREIADLILQDR